MSLRVTFKYTVLGVVAWLRGHAPPTREGRSWAYFYGYMKQRWRNEIGNIYAQVRYWRQLRRNRAR